MEEDPTLDEPFIPSDKDQDKDQDKKEAKIRKIKAK